MAKIKSLYVNGCSLTAGGGLYDMGVKRWYKQNHGIEWEYEKDVTYPRYIGDHFKIPWMNDATCGGGAPRVIRRTYEYIRKIGLEKARETLFLLQFNNPIYRVELYCEDINDYLVINMHYENGNTGKIEHFSAVQDFSPMTRKYPNEHFLPMFPEIKNIMLKYHSPIAYEDKIRDETLGFFSYLEFEGIPYRYTFVSENVRNKNEEFYKRICHKEMIIDGYESVADFTGRQKYTIHDETNGDSGDRHPGYFGYKKYGEMIIEYLKIQEDLEFLPQPRISANFKGLI
jgi:hypothetical protein